MIPRPVYIVERPDYSNLPTTLEAIGVGFWAYFILHHHLQPFLAGLCGIMATSTYFSLHVLKATFWLVALCGIVVWGGLGYGIALSMWPDDTFPKVFCALFGAAFSVGEKMTLYAKANDLPDWT